MAGKKWTVEELKDIHQRVNGGSDEDKPKRRNAGRMSVGERAERARRQEVKPKKKAAPKAAKPRKVAPPPSMPPAAVEPVERELEAEPILLDEYGRIIMDVASEAAPLPAEDEVQKWGQIELIPVWAAPTVKGTYLALAQDFLQALESSHLNYVARVSVEGYDALTMATEAVENYLNAWKGAESVLVWMHEGYLYVKRTEHWQ